MDIYLYGFPGNESALCLGSLTIFDDTGQTQTDTDRHRQTPTSDTDSHVGSNIFVQVLHSKIKN